MPVSPGAVLPRDMEQRHWAEFLSQSGIQGDRTVKSFTPTWGGFSVNPTGDISYMDFGAIVMLWSDAAITGTSNDTGMTITNLPSSITPSGERLVACIVINDGLANSGAAGIGSDGAIDFALEVPNTADAVIGIGFVSFKPTGTKGLPDGWLIIYPK